MSKRGIGMLNEPPKDFIDALKRIFHDQNLLAIYGITFLAALFIPFFVSFFVRKWHQMKLRKCQTRQSTSTEPMSRHNKDELIELPNGMVGFFNKSILDSLSVSDLSMTEILDEPKNSTLDKKSNEYGIEKRENNESCQSNNMEILDQEEIESFETTSFGESNKLLSEEKVKKENKPRKKYKNPDPETAEALNKLIEKGLHGKLATAQLRAKTHFLEEKMSDEERKKEQEIQQEQLAKIFEMMETQKEKFGINEKEELVEQMKLYGV